MQTTLSTVSDKIIVELKLDFDTSQGFKVGLNEVSTWETIGSGWHGDQKTVSQWYQGLTGQKQNH